MSTLEDLLDRLDDTRERTLVALETLPDEALVQPGVVGRWSIADLLSILTAWDAEVVTALARLQSGRPPERLLAALRNPDVYNAQRYQEAQGRTLDSIFEYFQASRLHLEEGLSRLSERALADPRHYRALGGEPLGRLIARATHQHEARYHAFLTAFADRWEDAEPPAVIPLDDIALGALGPPGTNGDANMPFPEDDDDDFE